MNEDTKKDENLPNYKIFWVDDSYHKNIVEKFYAANEKEAYDYLVEFRNANADGHVYYYGKIAYAKVYDCKTKAFSVQCIDPDICRLAFSSGKGLMRRIVDSISGFFSYWFYDKPMDLLYDISNLAYLLKHKEEKCNQWNLDRHLVDTMALNIPSLIKNSHSLMFLDEAIIKMHGNEPGFEISKWHKDHNYSYDKELEDLALRIQNEEYNKVLLNVKLYRYYLDFGFVDACNKDEVEFDKEWRHTLPVKEGTYDEFDYMKLNEMTQERWNNIWDWVKIHGQKLYD